MESEDVNRGGKKSDKKTKTIHARDFEDLKKFGKTKDRRSKHHDVDSDDQSDEEEHESLKTKAHSKDYDDENDTEAYIDHDHSDYHSNKHHIHDELERTHKHSGKHVIKYGDHNDPKDESDDEERPSKHHEASEQPEDFKGQIKKETENLSELMKKAE